MNNLNKKMSHIILDLDNEHMLNFHKKSVFFDNNGMENHKSVLSVENIAVENKVEEKTDKNKN